MADVENGQEEVDPLQDDGVADGLVGDDLDADADVGLSLDDSVDGDDAAAGQEDAGIEDPELEAIKARVKEMEEEAEKLKEMQNAVDLKMNMSSPTMSSAFPTMEEKIEADNRSVYVGNVDYGATAEELESHFHGCGSINRVTIQCDKYTGHPKGYAYVEFVDKESVVTSLALDDSLFRGRQIKVTAKRTNRPGISTTNRGGRRGGRRGARGYGGYSPRGRGRGRYRRYSPY